MRCKICSKTFRAPPPRMRDTQVCAECQGYKELRVKQKIQRNNKKRTEVEKQTPIPDVNLNQISRKSKFDFLNPSEPTVEQSRKDREKIKDDEFTVVSNTSSNPKNSANFYNNTVNMENVAVEDIDISKGQAEFLKSIMNFVRIGELTPMKLRQLLQKTIGMKHFINENWGDEEYFINLALNEKDSNQISQIFYFLNIKNKIERVPTKQDMEELSVIDISEYENRFGTWESFLDLLGYDPWYRKKTIAKKIQKPLKVSKKQFLQNETNCFDDNDSFKETIAKINTLKNQIEKDFRQRDSEDDYSDYSYVEMFQLLEKYLKILPYELKYGNIKNLI
jgi:hypothetical protein